MIRVIKKQNRGSTKSMIFECDIISNEGEKTENKYRKNWWW